MTFVEFASSNIACIFGLWFLNLLTMRPLNTPRLNLKELVTKSAP